MKIYITVLLTLLFPLGAFAQGEGNIWVFGTGAGIDFNSGSAVAISSSCTGAEGTASICTEDGDLLMYSNGKSVWNRENDMMPEGASLMASDPSSTSQASAIVPVPGSDSLFYVFSLEALGSDGGLYYSIVDMSLDGGLGDVIADETGILIDDGLCEKMTVVAGECENVWLIVHSNSVNEYYSYEITEEGISAPVVSVIGDGDFEGGYEVGVIKVSSDRTKMIASLYPGFSTGENGAEMYDFDPVTGIISNREVLIDASSDLWAGGFYYGACFSPDDSKAYFSNGTQLVQFDLSLATTADIIASGTYIASVAYGDMKAGPDGKIYVVSSFGGSLSTINSPNLAGTACDYDAASFDLDGTVTFGLPNAVVVPFISLDSNAVVVHDTTTCAFLTLSGREGATAYLWNTGATTESITVTTPGTYWVRSKNGCFSLDTFHVNIDTIPPPVIAVSDTIICGITGALTLNADVTNVIGTTYDWGPDLAVVSGDGTPTVVVNPSVDTQIIITATNHLDMCAASASDTIAVYVFDQSDVVILTPDTTICQHSMIPIWVIGPDHYSYSWAPETGIADPLVKTPILTGTASTPYVLTTRYHHCEAFDTIDINVEPAPVVDIGKDQALCDYDTLHMFAQTSPADFGPYTYDWDPGIYMDDSTSVKPVFHSIYPYSGQVIATATTPAGCVGSDTIIMTVNSSSFMQVSPTDTGLCPPAAVQLEATNAEQYKWIPDYGLSSDSIANPFANPVSSTGYLVMGTSKAGCIDSQYVHIEVFPNAVATLPDSVQIWPGESYQMSPGGNALYYSWFPSSGLSNPDIANPIAQPEVRTRYFYTATTENGCSVTDSIDVLVNTESILDMPNAFVPGSTSNGSLKIGRRGIANLKSYAIFNRWGNKVFETSNLDEGWDGSFNGKPQPTGVYIYQIEATTAQGKPFNKQGNVTLIR